jgi:hypothetical protein
MKELLILAGLVLGGYTVSYMIQAAQTHEEVKQINAKTITIDREEAREIFMSECDTGEYDGARFDQTAYCSCTFNELVNRVGINQMAKDGLNMTEAEMLNKYEPEINTCLRRQGIEI